MKKIFLLFILLFGTLYLGFSQEYADVIYLKNGSVIKGVIIEQTTNQKIKLKTNDGSIFVYEFNEIEKIEKILKEKDESDHTISMEKTTLSGYRFYQDNIRLNLFDLQKVVTSNPETYIMIKKAKRSYIRSYALAYVGIAFLGIELAEVTSGYSINSTSILVGTVSIIGSRILWRRYKKNVKTGIDIYNTDIKANTHFKLKPDLRIGVTNNGIGLVMIF